MLLETRGCLDYDERDLPPDLPTLGLAYGCQVVDAVPMADHDRPMAALATEHGLWVFAKTSEDEV